jgi:apolipoprotein N-acyltransferase
VSPLGNGPGTDRSSRSDADTWRSLGVAERCQVMWAMIRGRPLPARLARAATERGHQLRWSASFFGYLYLVLGVLWLTAVVGDVIRHSPQWLLLAFYCFAAVGFLSAGAAWLAVIANVKRAERAGPWPER